MKTPIAIDLAAIDIGKRLRPADPAAVAKLADSIAEIGLQTPISVIPWERWDEGRRSRDCYLLVTGLHRLEAMKALGRPCIDAVVIDDMSEHDRKLWEIDENLMRAELGPAMLAKHLVERKMWYEGKHPETRATKDGGGFKGNQHTDVVTDKLSVTTFAKDTADKTGLDERSVRRATRRGENIAEDVLDRVAGTRLDTGRELDALARLPDKEQRKMMRDVERGNIESIRDVIDRRKQREAAAAARAEQRQAKASAAKRLLELQRLWGRHLHKTWLLASADEQAEFLRWVASPAAADAGDG